MTRFCAYEVKNNCCSFERVFIVKKVDVFLYGIYFFLLEILTFLCYANEGGDDVIGGSTKTVLHSIANISGNIKAVFFKLGTTIVHHKRNKMTLCCSFLTWFGHDFPAGQFVSVRSYLIAATTWYSGFFLLSLVTRFACDIGQLARIWIWVSSEVITILVSIWMSVDKLNIS